MIEPNTESNKTRFLFVRHGQTDHNINKIFQGHLDIALNKEGHNQAELFGKKFSKFPFDKIYSSDLTRCKETVGKLITAMDEEKEVTFTNELRERFMGDVQGMHIDDAIEYGKKHGKHYREFGEDSTVFAERLGKFIKKLEAESAVEKYKNVGVVSHGGTIRAVLQLVGVADAGVVYNTSVTVLDYYFETDKWVVQFVGDTEHLGQQMNVQDQRVR